MICGEPFVRVADLLARARALAGGERRVVLGITGAPGAGKTTLVHTLLAALGEDSRVAHVPMDGFHLADVQLDRLGLRERKGAPETFDAAGYLSVLQRILHDDGQTVFVPGFDRTLEQPVAASIAVLPPVRLVVTEGNYLLLDDDVWASARHLMHEVWYLDLPPAVRLQRLAQRHEVFGKTPAAALAWAEGPDQANADLVEATRARADLVVTLG